MFGFDRGNRMLEFALHAARESCLTAGPPCCRHNQSGCFSTGAGPTFFTGVFLTFSSVLNTKLLFVCFSSVLNATFFLSFCFRLNTTMLSITSPKALAFSNCALFSLLATEFNQANVVTVFSILGRLGTMRRSKADSSLTNKIFLSQNGNG